MEICEVRECDKVINKDGLCLRHKLLKVYVATVPGSLSDRQKGISKRRNLERGLHHYRDLKQAGEQPSGTSLDKQARDSYKKHLWEKHEDSITNENPPETVTQIKRSLTNLE